MNASISLHHLTQILTDESRQCDLLVQNIRQEREAMKRLAVHDFDSINQGRIAILESLSRLKSEFDACVQHLGAAYHVPESGRTLTEVLHRAYGTQAEVVLQQYEGLAGKVRKVKQDIAVNQLLIKNVQSFLIRAAEAHHQNHQEDELYSASGIRSAAASQAVMLKRKG